MKRFEENADVTRRASESVLESLNGRVDEEQVSCLLQAQGEYEGYFTNARTGEVTPEIADHNLIVLDFSKLVCALLKIQPGYTGLQYWAIGSGESSWDDLTTADRAAKSNTGLHQLYNEVARTSIVMDFITADNVVTSSLTNRLEIRATFGLSISGSIREFGIFGGNATSAKNTGKMIDHKAHAVVSFNVDAAEMTWNRILRLTL